MEEIINFFKTASPLVRISVFASCLIFFWILEGIIPLFQLRYNKIRHFGVNLFFTLVSIVINLSVAFIIVFVSDGLSSNQNGLLYLVKMPLWLFIIIGILILDFFSAYLIHVIQHKIRWMWKFHLVHHTDKFVNATTAHRHHPFDSLLHTFFMLFAVILTGSPVWLLILYQFVSVFFSFFSHANISLPTWLDRGISWIFVSPNMHKVHHHNSQPLTDKNFGNIFSIWDRLFGTFYMTNTQALTYGVDTYTEEGRGGLKRLLIIPFKDRN